MAMKAVPSSHSPEAPPSTFPQNPEEFDADPRVSFSKLDNKFILEADDGQEYEFDDALKRWVPVVRPHPPANEGYPIDMILRSVTYYSDGEF